MTPDPDVQAVLAEIAHLGGWRGAVAEEAVHRLAARLEAAEAEAAHLTSEIDFKKKALRNCRKAHLAAEAERDEAKRLLREAINQTLANKARVAQLEAALDAADWLITCYRDIEYGKPVRGLGEAIAGYASARAALAGEGCNDSIIASSASGSEGGERT